VENPFPVGVPGAFVRPSGRSRRPVIMPHVTACENTLAITHEPMVAQTAACGPLPRLGGAGQRSPCARCCSGGVYAGERRGACGTLRRDRNVRFARSARYGHKSGYGRSCLAIRARGRTALRPRPASFAVRIRHRLLSCRLGDIRGRATACRVRASQADRLRARRAPGARLPAASVDRASPADLNVFARQSDAHA